MEKVTQIISGSDPRLICYVEDKIKHTDDNYDYYGPDWRDIKEHNRLHSSIIVAHLDGDCVIAFAEIVNKPISELLCLETSPVSFWVSTCSLDNDAVRDIAIFIRSHFPNIILYWEYYGDTLNDAGFVPANLRFHYENGKQGEYNLAYSYPYVSKDREHMISEKIRNYYGRHEIVSVSCKALELDALDQEIYPSSYPALMTYEKESGNRRFLGFHYFSPDDLRSFYRHDKRVVFICAYSEEMGNTSHQQKLIGVLKIVHNGSFWTLSYIDVHFDYRRMGIATRLYESLNQFLNEDDTLVSTSLSPQGKEAKLDVLRRSIVDKCLMFDDLSSYSEYLSNQRSA